MNDIPTNLKGDLLNYLPPYILEEVTCFVFGDKHPMGKKNVDITVCTHTKPGTASVKELYQHEIVNSLPLQCTSKPSQVILLRNQNCELFYVVSAGEELFLLNGDKLTLLRKISNVVVFDITDNMCAGEGKLRVMSTDHVNALEFDDSLNIVQEEFNTADNSENSPAVTDLQCKLTAARYNVAQNETLLEDYRNLRHSAAFEMFQRMHPCLSESVFDSGCQKVAEKLRINLRSQWIKTFNNCLVIVIELNIENDIPLEDIKILIQEHSIPTMVYRTKIFEATTTPPYWTEIKTRCILKKNISTAIVTAFELKELEHCFRSRLELSGLLLYKIEGKEKYLSLDKIEVSSEDIKGDSFNLLCGSCGKQEVLAILAASMKTELRLHHIKKIDEVFYFQDLLKKFGLETMTSGDNVWVYKKSPYDRLNGIMIVISKDEFDEGPVNLAVYSRNESQVLFLIQLIQETSDKRIVITTPNYRVEAKSTELSEFNIIPTEDRKTIDVEKLTKSLLKQVTITKEYYEDCMAKMHESKDSNVISNIGKAIDIFACGPKSFEEFSKSLVEEISTSVDIMNESVIVKANDSEDLLMVVESEEF